MLLMGSMRNAGLIALFYLSMSAYGQDTVSVYFAFGKSRIPADQLLVLDEIPRSHDLSRLDSAHFIGMADPIGGTEGNMRLSDRRAKAVATYFDRFLPPNMPVRSFAMGAQQGEDHAQKRRVDVVLHFPLALADTLERIEEDTLSEFCFATDYRLLHHAHVRQVKKGRREFVLIELSGRYLSSNPTGYWIDINRPSYYGMPKKGGEFDPVRLKWSKANTRGTRYPNVTTLIPKQAFDQYRILYKKTPPCPECNEFDCVQVDRLVMAEIQFRRLLFQWKWIGVRALRHHIDLNSRYYLDCDPSVPVEWTERKGRKHKDHLYTKLPVLGARVSNIARDMLCCTLDDSGCGTTFIGWIRPCEPDRSLRIVMEAGGFNRPGSALGYAVLGLSKAGWMSQTSLLAGFHTDGLPIAIFRYQVHLLDLPLEALFPVRAYRWPDALEVMDRYVRAYVGSELRTLSETDTEWYWDLNVHAGLACVNYRQKAIWDRIFVQAGPVMALSNEPKRRFFGSVQLGVQLRLVRFSSREG